ncbi:MAG: ATP-dependent RecD-like DNA helicase [Erysipelotrichaceae bacterium]|nr:ATP-dependent RecD-like DNA helicase [Erysipelotrichaceae bacterium]
MMEYTGVITHVRFYSQDTKFIVATFDSQEEDKPFTITGSMSYVYENERYRIKGEFVMHPRYGQQFQIQSYEIILADNRDDIIHYLSSPLFKGIGKMQAEKIADALGDDALNMIREDPSCLEIVPGMTQRKMEAIVKVMNDQSFDQQVLSFFMEHDLSTRFMGVITSFYKDDTLTILRNNPYQLIDDIDGIGFKSADTLAMKIGFTIDDPHRLTAAVKAALNALCFATGSTYASHDDIKKAYHRLIQIEEDQFDEYLEANINAHSIVQEEDRYYTKELHDSEVTIASYFKRFRRIMAEEFDEEEVATKLKNIETQLGIDYDEIQKDAITTFLKEPVMILTGGPGTGKTTIVQGILKLYRAFHPDEEIALAAPTGRAAKRLSDLSGIEATTIHRLLKWDMHTNHFSKNETDPLDVQLLVVDEFSMVDSLLMSNLLKAAPRVRKIILIGDDQQLPSVSPGRVLADLIESQKIPVIALNHVYRQEEGSGIVSLAHSIRNDVYDSSIFGEHNDIHFTLCQNYEVVPYVKHVVSKAIENGYDVDDIQVLVPMYNGVAGIDALNIMLQELFNPADSFKQELQVGRRLYREGDRVLQLKNRPDDDVYNGDIGTLVEIIPKAMDANQHDRMIVDFDGNFVEYPSTDFNNLTHAYCMSVHKSQGNEFKIVVMAALSDYRIMMRKNLLYTAITRAKRSLFILGSHQVFTNGLKRVDDERRLTTLTSRMTRNMRIADFED